jgi:transketolase
MRKTFIDTLCKIAKDNENVWLLSGDLGYNVLEQFSTQFPHRYINTGVAEQNMMGVAAGLSLSGKIVFTYSISNFTIMRCLEQIRNDVCYHNLNVNIIGVGGGFTYGSAGYSHHAVEDYGVLMPMPNMSIFVPCDPIETKLCIEIAYEFEGPSYIRLEKNCNYSVHSSVPDYSIGHPIQILEGKDATIVCTGGIVNEAMKAAKSLAELDINVSISSLPTVKPIDITSLAAILNTPIIMTIDEHSEFGGISQLVNKAIIQYQINVHEVVNLCISDDIIYSIGSQDFIRHKLSMTSKKIKETIIKLMNS